MFSVTMAQTHQASVLEIFEGKDLQIVSPLVTMPYHLKSCVTTFYLRYFKLQT